MTALPAALRRRLARTGLLLFVLAGVSACHTIEGLGQDLSALGDVVSSKAQGHER